MKLSFLHFHFSVILGFYLEYYIGFPQSIIYHMGFNLISMLPLIIVDLRKIRSTNTELIVVEKFGNKIRRCKSCDSFPRPHILFEKSRDDEILSLIDRFDGIRKRKS